VEKTALIWAAENNRKEIVEMLLKISNTDINWKDLFRERKRMSKISNIDTLRCMAPSQRDLKLKCGMSFFDSHVFNCAMYSGKWYYEFVMPEISVDAIQVGVTTLQSKLFYHVGYEFFWSWRRSLLVVL